MAKNDTKIQEFEKLFKKYHNDLYGYGMKLCGNREIVLDQIQELFLSLWHRRDPLDQIKSQKSYLLISLRRKILIFLDKEKKGPKLKGEWEEFASFTFNSEEIIVRKEIEENRKSALQEALNQLPVRQREVVYLRFYRGLSYEEIEEVLSINYQSAVNHVYRAKNKLLSILESHQSKILLIVLVTFSLVLSI